MHFCLLIEEPELNSLGKFHVDLPKNKVIRSNVVASECYIQDR